MSEFDTIPHIEPGIYRHYKGGVYRVLGVGRHTESDDYFVVYAPLEPKADMPALWLRPFSMFVEHVIVGDVRKSRFERIGD